ncbi:hypothetical protein BD413DRAFT_566465 [Trametes elegans]|nr:hypothetical protein BD413DRAFT_566465 [Trametes elegans]
MWKSLPRFDWLASGSSRVAVAKYDLDLQLVGPPLWTTSYTPHTAHDRKPAPISIVLRDNGSHRIIKSNCIHVLLVGGPSTGRNRTIHMEYLSETHSKLLLPKEWLVMGDADATTPYFLKFYASTAKTSCCILITDTKNVWGEVLSSNQFARRWDECNPQHSAEGLSPKEEESWRATCLKFLSSVHTMGGVDDMNLEQVKTTYSDRAVELKTDTFRWRWETFIVGPRLSADILSMHLIMPMISSSHAAFYSHDSPFNLPEEILENSVDMFGKLARFTAVSHAKNTLGRPIIATTIQRAGAVLNFVPKRPRISKDAPAPDLTVPTPPTPARTAPGPPLRRAASPSATLRGFLGGEAGTSKSTARGPPRKLPPGDDDSVTEEESDEDDEPAPSGKGKQATKDLRETNTRSASPARSVPSKRATPDQQAPPASGQSPNRSFPHSSSPLPPPKKAKKLSSTSSSDDGDSGGDRKGRAAPGKSTARRGVKQPIRRGGKRF